MANRKSMGSRLAKIEAEQAAAIERHDAPIRARLVAFVQDQPAPTAASFWRVCREKYESREVGASALSLCGGTFDVTAEDRAVYARLVSEFFDGGRWRGSEPDPAPLAGVMA